MRVHFVADGPVTLAGLRADFARIAGPYAPLAASYGIPFEHVPVTKETKAEAEARLLNLVEAHEIELAVLARYMQVLSDDLCKRMEGRMINIHHSFLPSFKGAKPYHQAFARGVKVVGATAHYVTPDLDEGPIIELPLARPSPTVALNGSASRCCQARGGR